MKKKKRNTINDILDRTSVRFLKDLFAELPKDLQEWFGDPFRVSPELKGLIPRESFYLWLLRPTLESMTPLERYLLRSGLSEQRSWSLSSKKPNLGLFAGRKVPVLELVRLCRFYRSSAVPNERTRPMRLSRFTESVYLGYGLNLIGDFGSSLEGKRNQELLFWLKNFGVPCLKFNRNELNKSRIFRKYRFGFNLFLEKEVSLSRSAKKNLRSNTWEGISYLVEHINSKPKLEKSRSRYRNNLKRVWTVPICSKDESIEDFGRRYAILIARQLQVDLVKESLFRQSK